MRLSLDDIAAGLIETEPGFWTSRKRSPVPYPEAGNQLCSAVEEASFWFRHRNRCILTLLSQYPPPGTFFDIGGGNGYVAQALERAGFETVLVEPGVGGVRTARQRGLAHVIHSTMADAEFHSNSLSAAGLFDVLEHLRDDLEFLGELRRLLMPGGRLYLTVPAYQFLWSSDDDFACHERRYALQDLTRKLERSRFRTLRATYFFALLPLPIFLLRTLPSRMGLRRNVSLSTTHREHATSSRLVKRLIDPALVVEAEWLRRGRKLPTGASCLVAAEAE
jgi:SAM-dependent methyltransferase